MFYLALVNARRTHNTIPHETTGNQTMRRASSILISALADGYLGANASFSIFINVNAVSVAVSWRQLVWLRSEDHS